MRKLKRIFVVVLVLTLVFAAYVMIVNRHSTGMTTRQKIMKAIYPALMFFTKNKKKMHTSEHAQQAAVSFYSLKFTGNDQQEFDFSTLKGKKVLLVNTASDCGYTPQYADLQKLYEEQKDKLVIIGFPANDFKEQEKGSDEDIAQFCQRNFGVTFPLMKKSVVVPGESQNPVFRWLTDPKRNGWNDTAPEWNFSKYLVDEKGELLYYFPPGISPTGPEIRKALAE